MVISSVQLGDSLNFANTAQISGSYSSGAGVLTLSGTATPAQYQAALQSVTFSSTSTSTVTRSISVAANDGNISSSQAAETVNVAAPLTVTGLYVRGTGTGVSNWGTTFTNDLSSTGLGTPPRRRWVLPCKPAPTRESPPWVNVNVIEATFNEAVNINQNSLILSGGTGGATPSVTGFSQFGTSTYAWTLSTALTANRSEISFRATGANAVTDASGAGLSGNWTSGTSNFPSGNGLAGTSSSSDFNFLFNALPGEAARKAATWSLRPTTSMCGRS